MRNITLTQTLQTNQKVNVDHFGGNVIFRRNTDNGEPDQELTKALNELDITVTRYPAGETDIAFATGMLENGSLPTHLTNYLDSARSNGNTVIIVTPTHAAYDGPDDFSEFARQLATEYSDVVHAFEIGNEYWGHQTETSYGQVANDTAIALNNGMLDAGVDFPIWVQMGDAGGKESEFHGTKDDRGWITRNVDANTTIIDQLTHTAREIIDGTIEHYYFRDQSQALGDLANDQLITMDDAIWKSELGDDLSLNLTEWNIRTTNYEQLGMRAGSTMLSQFSYILEMGADSASIWAPMHNTSSDLAGADTVFIDGDTGVVANSVGGAIFDLMSSSIVGLEHLRSYVDSDSSMINHHVYADDETVVVYLASRSEAQEAITFSLGDLFSGAQIDRATLVGYDKSSSNGQYYHYQEQRFVDAEFVTIDGERYYLNEHDVRASVEYLNLGAHVGGGEFSVELMPYEVVELVYTIPKIIYIYGTSGVDRHQDLEGVNEAISTLSGDDVIRAGSGNDTISAGDGNDYIDTGSDSDTAYGARGDDTIKGWGGDDSLFGGEGHDRLYGWAGNDSLEGGLGSDLLDGGNGSDTLISNDSNDTILAGAGDDEVQLRAGSFTVDSAVHAILTDFSHFHPVLEFSDSQRSFNQSNVDGGSGIDTLILTEEADIFVFKNDDSNNMNQPDLQVYSSNVSGIEVVDSGDGDDILSLSRDLGSSPISVFGGAGDDVILGGMPGDEIYGGFGRDTIWADSATGIWGGAGGDTFVVRSLRDMDRVRDYDEREGDEIIFLFDELLVSRPDFAAPAYNTYEFAAVDLGEDSWF